MNAETKGNPIRLGALAVIHERYRSKSNEDYFRHVEDDVARKMLKAIWHTLGKVEHDNFGPDGSGLGVSVVRLDCITMQPQVFYQMLSDAFKAGQRQDFDAMRELVNFKDTP